MRGLFRPIIGMVLVLFLTACGGDSREETPPDPKAKADTTLLVYIVGSDLESDGNEGTNNINEMLAAASSDKVNVVLQTGGARKDGWRTGMRKQVYNGEIIHLADIGSPNMGDPDTLADFITWAQSAFPAEQYMLAFWNHGGGPLGGFGVDEITGDGLSIPEIQTALSKAGQKFEFIGFDACLMASVEIAQALAPHGNYLGASQDLEPGPGWDWTAIVDYLVAHPTASGAEFGRALADAYAAKAGSETDYFTFSITDLRAVPALVQTMERIAHIQLARLTDGTDAGWLDMAYARRHSLDFFTSQFFGPYVDLVDVDSFLQQPPVRGEDDLMTEFEQAMDAAVVYQVLGESIPNASGLTMYFPTRSIDDTDSINTYQKLDFSPDIKQWVARYIDIGNSDLIDAPVVSMPAAAGDQASAALNNLHWVSAFATRSEGDLIYTMKPVNYHEDRLQTSITQGWPSVNGTPVIMFPDESQFDVDSARYTIPVAVVRPNNTVGTKALLQVSYARDLDGQETYEIDDFFLVDLGFTEAAPRRVLPPPGLRLTPLVFDSAAKSWQAHPNWSNQAVIVIPEYDPNGDDETDTDWGFQLVDIPAVSGSFQFGVNDYRSAIHLSPTLQ